MNPTTMHPQRDPSTVAPSMAAPTDPRDGTVVEWAPFRLADGVSDDALLEASDALQREFLSRQPGFVRRELLKGPQGRWSDLVIWQDEPSVKAAMQAVAESPACRRYFSLLQAPDGGSLGVELLDRVRRY